MLNDGVKICVVSSNKRTLPPHVQKKKITQQIRNSINSPERAFEFVKKKGGKLDTHKHTDFSMNFNSLRKQFDSSTAGQT